MIFCLVKSFSKFSYCNVSKGHPFPGTGDFEGDFIGDTTGFFADFLIRQIIGAFRGDTDENDVQTDFQNSLSAADQYSDWKKYIMAEMVYFLSFLWLGKSEIICYNYTEKINSKGEF